MRPIGLWSMSMTRSTCSSPVDRAARRRVDHRLLQCGRDVAVQRVDHQRRLARARDAGDAGHQPERDLHGHVAQVVARGADDAQRPAALRRGTHGRHRDAAPAAQVLAGERLGRGLDFRGRALRDHAAAVDAGAGTEVHDVVRLADRVLVVLHDQHGVAEVAQPRERVEQALVVALVQADRRLVEDVHHADQPRADLAREPDALRLAARQRLGAAVERQVVEADVHQEGAGGRRSRAPGGARSRPRQPSTSSVAEEAQRVGDRQRGDLRQRAAADEHVARREVEPAAAAVGAGPRAAVLGEFLAHRGRFGLAVAALEVGQDAFPRVAALRGAAPRVEVAELDAFLAAAVQQHVAHGLRQVAPRRLDVEAVVTGQRLDQLEVVRVAAVPAAHRAARQRQGRVHHHPRRVEVLLQAEAAAGAAGAAGVVEREQPRLELHEAVAADRAGVAVGEDQRRPGRLVLEHDARHALRQRERGLERFREALRGVGAHAQPVHHGVHRVPPPRLEGRQRVELDQLAVDECTDEALRAQVLERLGVLALAVLHHRREQQHGGTLGQRQHLVHHLAHRLRGEVLAVLGAARHAGARVEHAQVVEHLGHGADRGARVVRGGLLLDGDRGREALDVVDVRLLHHRQELPGIGRQRLDVAALALGVDGVEGERRLARARQAGDHDQPVARQVEVDALQVVGARTADAYDVHGLASGSSG